MEIKKIYGDFCGHNNDCGGFSDYGGRCGDYSKRNFQKNGNNLKWVLDADGTLTINGMGDMCDWIYFSDPSATFSPTPWDDYISNGIGDEIEIKNVVIEDGVTSIGNSAFAYTSLSNIEIPDSVKSINYGTFRYCSSLSSIKIPTSVTSIDSSAFLGCDNLFDVYYGGTREE